MSRLIESTLAGKISRALLESENLNESDGWIAFYNGKKVEISKDEANDLYGAKQVAIKKLNVPKSKSFEVAIEPAYNDENIEDAPVSNAQFECDKVLKESIYDELADFIADLDPYGYRDEFGDDKEAAVNYLKGDKENLIKYLEEIIEYDESTTDMIERAKELLRELKQTNESEDITTEELDKEDEENIKHNKKVIEDKIAELKVAIQDGVSEDEKEAMEKEITELEKHLNESGYGKEHVLEEAWSGTIKSGGALRQAIRDAGEEPTDDDCRYVLDKLKDCCEEAKTLTDDEYYQNGFQSIIDDIEMIYDDDDLELGNVDWELDGFYDWCDAANLWCDLGESNINEAYKAEDGKYPPYRFDEEDAEFIRNLLGPGFKVEITSSSSDEASQGTLVISLDNKYVSGFMGSTRELDNEIDKYFAEKNPEAEVHRNNTGMILWLGDKSKNESANLTEGDDMDYYDEGIYHAIEEALNDAGFDVERFTDAGVMTYNIGWEVSKDGESTQLDCPGSWYDPKQDKNSDYYEGGDDDEDYDESAKPVNESVSVVAPDGSTVDTEDAASVSLDNNTVSITNGQTTVTITSTPSEPAIDIPQEEPIEEVPADEIVPEEPIENEVPVEDEVIEAEDPIKDDVKNDLNIEPGSDEEEMLDSLYDEEEEDVIDAESLSIIKNQGNVYMIQLDNSDLYYVCEDFDSQANVGSNASFYNNKEDADKDYFERVGIKQ